MPDSLVRMPLNKGIPRFARNDRNAEGGDFLLVRMTLNKGIPRGVYPERSEGLGMTELKNRMEFEARLLPPQIGEVAMDFGTRCAWGQVVLTSAEHPVGGIEGVVVVAPGPAEPFVAESLHEGRLGIGDARPAALEEGSHSILEARPLALPTGVHGY